MASPGEALIAAGEPALFFFAEFFADFFDDLGMD
jgi:hypothetical protein